LSSTAGRWRVVWSALACLGLTAPAHAQLAGSNLLLAQLGNWPPSMPDRGTPDRESFYDRLDIQWLSGSILAGARFETDRNSDLENEYAGFSASPTGTTVPSTCAWGTA